MFLSKASGGINQKANPGMSTNHLINENEIILASQKNPRYFKAIYENYYNPILNYINCKVNDIEIAADITSNVFYKALLNLKKYKDQQVPFAAWLYKIAFNETMQFFRKTKKKRTVVLDADLMENIAEEIRAENNADLLQMVIKVVESLNDNETEIIDQKYFQQKSNREIAFILGISEGNLKVKTHRIIKKIKKLIAESNEQV